jgi:small subunit ribosomal protein S13
MPRLLGVDIPGNKTLPYALRYIYGIGPKIADDVIEAAKMDSNRRAHELSEEEINKIAGIIADKKLKVEGDLRRDIMGNLKRLQAINCYRGIRHRRGLPVNGQRTQSNARTRKGKRKTVSVSKKVESDK